MVPTLQEFRVLDPTGGYMKVVAEFLKKVSSVYATGAATEHSYRSSLEFLLANLDKAVTPLNEPKRVKCGAPDFIIQRGEVAVGHVEAKDLDIDLGNMNESNKAQQKRYLGALPNLLYTNCLDFEFFRDGQRYASVCIAKRAKTITPIPGEFEKLENLLKDFLSQTPQTVTAPRLLANIMAGKAALIKDVLFNVLKSDTAGTSELSGQFKAFKEHLIHDITLEDFADLYAETVAYGMFAARLHDDTPKTFSRTEALDLLPKSNPFLRSLFGYIAGPELDDNIKWIIDDLAEVFQATDIKKVMAGFGKLTGQNDPFLHFYETFLAAYNPSKRKARGVWYTPEPVVNFIVRAVDEVLRDKFKLTDGLADTSTVTLDWDTGQSDKKGKPLTVKKTVHRVQILDPATGTGTFLAEAVKQIAPKVKGAVEDWSPYVEKELIPRLHGFELLMASYAMCHMKLDMMLTELDYQPTAQPPRLSVYLTNSLEEGERDVRDLFMAQWLTREAREANNIKRQQPIMCVIGNPPYSIQSGNLTPHQVSLVKGYRSVDGKPIKEKGMLQFEKNINNDYVKFMAFGEQLIRKRGYGILGFVTSHGYLKSSSFRGMRNHLMRTFDEIFILDLHGNSEVREVVPEGAIDKNIFDIKQGVSVIIAYRTADKIEHELGKVKYAELWGARQKKYDVLQEATIKKIKWTDCSPRAPNYTFHPSGKKQKVYAEEFFALNEFMPVYSSGVITARDDFVVGKEAAALVKNAEEFAGHTGLTDEQLCEKLGISLKKGWDVGRARKRLRAIKDFSKIIHDISYRPFDNRKILFDESVVWTTARSTMDHMLRGDNLAFVSARSEKSGTCSHFYVSKTLVETKCGERTTQSAVFPLYIYPEEGSLEKDRKENFNPKLHRRLLELAKHPKFGKPRPEDIFDYMYGIVHSREYRDAYAEFLKIEFPRIPWPSSPAEFWRISSIGRQLRDIHLLEDEAIGQPSYPLKGKGSSVVEAVSFDGNKVWVNGSQYFDNVPETAWTFFVGGVPAGPEMAQGPERGSANLQ
jgi:hypothetical protein